MTDLTTSADRAPSLAFSSPDGHTWELDTDHQAGPRAPMMRAVFDEAFRRGMKTAFGRIGAPLSHAEACHVHGWSYLRMVPAGVPDKPGAGAPPPAPVLKVLTRLIPELRRREKTARRTLADELWMADVRAWWDERPDRDRTFRAHQEIELTALDDAALANAIDGALADGLAMLERHFELVTPAVGIGLALLSAVEHGLEPIEVAEALRGASASTAAPGREIGAIADALDRAGAGPVSSLDDVRAASAEAGDLVDEYLSTYGWRILADDLDAPALAESPGVLVRTIEQRRRATPPDERIDPIAALVARIPTDARGQFERRLRQAAEAYEALDDNSSFTCWGLGVARRQLLEAGRRLVDRGVFEHPDDLWLLDVGEVRSALTGAPPSAKEIAARRSELAAQREADAPEVLGGPASPPPDPGVFPRGLRTIAQAVGLYLSLRFPPADEHADTGRVEVDGRVIATGHGIGGATATGRAVVAMTPHDAIERLEPGDILVCPVTNPAYNVVFPMVAGVVTSAGGPFGHTAVTAREVGIPAVVGIGDLSVIADGAEIVVRSGV